LRKDREENGGEYRYYRDDDEKFDERKRLTIE
jgi:hypothetical protein